MWTLMSDGEATEAIGVVADIRRESKFNEVASLLMPTKSLKRVELASSKI